MKSECKDFIRRCLLFLLSRLQTKQKDIPQFADFFVFPENCQIPNLGFIYEFFLGRKKGNVLEIGAFDGYSFSNSLGLIQRGWTAHLYEPVPKFYEECKLQHLDCESVTVFNQAVGKDFAPIKIRVAGALSSAHIETLDEYSTSNWSSSHLTEQWIEVPTIPLSEAFARMVDPVDVLIVDVEGYETEVFETFSSCGVLPKLLIVELADLHPEIESSRGRSRSLYIKLLAYDYIVVYKDKINTIFCLRSIYDETYESISH